MADDTDKASKPGLGMVAWIAILAALSVLAGGLGAGIGLLLIDEVAAHAEVEKKAEQHEPEPVHYSSGEQLIALPVVTANLSQPSQAWIRIEAAAVFKTTSEHPRDVLVTEIAGDILAYVRTLKMSQLQGSYGLMHLRDDLNERAAIRSNGDVKEVIIHALVME